VSAAKHTPGPWHVRDGYGLLKAEVGTADRAVAAVWTKEMPRGKEDQKEPTAWPEGEANACLISAAPDLLDACEEALGCLNGAEVALPGYVVAALERAIAKATGSAA
jgi:hypothetical protein